MIDATVAQLYARMGTPKMPPPSPDRVARTLLPLLAAFVENETRELLKNVDCFSLTADGCTIGKRCVGALLASRACFG